MSGQLYSERCPLPNNEFVVIEKRERQVSDDHGQSQWPAPFRDNDQEQIERNPDSTQCEAKEHAVAKVQTKCAVIHVDS